MDADTLLILKDAAERIGIGHALARGLIDVRSIPYRRIGRAIVLDADGLAALERAAIEWRNRPQPYSRKAAAAGATG